jgi:hypothetical protein
MSIIMATPIGSGRLTCPEKYADVLAMSLLGPTLHLAADGPEKLTEANLSQAASELSI